MFARLLYQGVQRRLVGYAGGDGDGALSPAPRVDGGRHLLAGLLLAAGNHHIGARLRKCFRNGAPDAAGRAGDDRCLAAQFEQIPALLPFVLPPFHELPVVSSSLAMQARLPSICRSLFIECFFLFFYFLFFPFSFYTIFFF